MLASTIPGVTREPDVQLVKQIKYPLAVEQNNQLASRAKKPVYTFACMRYDLRMSKKSTVHTLASISAAARHWGVSRATIYKWASRGYLVFYSKTKIDITASELLLRERPEVYRGGHASGPHAEA